MTSNNHKKPKMSSVTADDDDEKGFDALKQYLLAQTVVPSTHPALAAALQGLDQAQRRRARDAKLQAKFSSSTSTTSKATDVDQDVVVVASRRPPESKSPSSGDNNHLDEDMEWQTVVPQTSTTTEATKELSVNNTEAESMSSSYLGSVLAQQSVEALAQHQIHVQSPLGAMAAVLHAALVSKEVGFSCTGIPESSSNNKNGFAAPIRELPKSQFLPLNWEGNNSSGSNSSSIQLRYRKPASGAVVLTVQQQQQPTEQQQSPMEIVTVQLQKTPSPSSSNGQEEEPEALSFALEEHMNLDSFAAAKKQRERSSTRNNNNSSIRIPPALHYKGLASLLTKFCQTFDLGAMPDDDDTHQGILPYMDHTAIAVRSMYENSSSTAPRKSDFVVPEPVRVPAGTSSSNNNDDEDDDIRKPRFQVPTTVDQAFPPQQPRAGAPGPSRGDFADDLVTGGMMMRDPLRIGGGRMGGNLLGPNHPMFGQMGGAYPQPPFEGGGPGAMHPRFDPPLPPGVVDPNATRAGRGNNSRGRRHPYDPNPDHLPPPNSFGGGNNDSMFS